LCIFSASVLVREALNFWIDKIIKSVAIFLSHAHQCNIVPCNIRKCYMDTWCVLANGIHGFSLEVRYWGLQFTKPGVPSQSPNERLSFICSVLFAPYTSVSKSSNHALW
jgi:hypothetical protein